MSDIIKRIEFFTDAPTAYREMGITRSPLQLASTTTASKDATGACTTADLNIGYKTSGLYDNDPSNYVSFNVGGTSKKICIQFYDISHNYDTTRISGIDQIQILGHNLHYAGAKFEIAQHPVPHSWSSAGGNSSGDDYPTLVDRVNCNISTSSGHAECSPSYNGYSIASWDPATATNSGIGKYFTTLVITPIATNYAYDVVIGSVRFGSRFRTSHNADISEKKSFNLSSKKIKSLGGTEYSVRTHNNPVWWNNIQPFQLTDEYSADVIAVQPMRNLKRIHECSFTYVSDQDSQIENQTNRIFFNKSFDNIMNQTFGDHIPVVINLDAENNANTLDQSQNNWIMCYIAKFDKTRISPNLWNINLELVET